MVHGSSNNMAINATLHCLSGCAIGEILGLILGTALGLSNAPTIILSVALAFVFGYALTAIPLVKTGVAVAVALGLAFASDTFSVASMEVIDNTVMAAIPGAMNAGLVNPLFWLTMPVSLAAAFVVAVPVNKFLISRGRGHMAVMHHLGHH